LSLSQTNNPKVPKYRILLQPALEEEFPKSFPTNNEALLK
jgi:hypothetical protein